MTGRRPPLGGYHYSKIWHLALPLILANLTVPLLGMVDTAVIGNLSAAHIGSVALSSMIFSFLFWSLAFIRFSATGLTAQAYGAGTPDEVFTVLSQTLGVSVIFGTIFIVAEQPIISLSLFLFDSTDKVETLASEYMGIRILCAPATLANIGILGWLIGLQKVKTALALQVLINGVNIIFDVLLAIQLEMGVHGVAWATVIAQYAGLLTALWIIANTKLTLGAKVVWRSIVDRTRLSNLMGINRDLFLRSICVITSVAMFTAQGAKMGELVLAANGILILFLSLLSHGLDGFAHAAETLVGHAIGEKNRAGLRKAVIESTKLALFVSVAYVCLYGALGNYIISAITDIRAVQQEAAKYLIWVVIAPLISVWAFQLDGIFIGATRAKEMRNAMFVSFFAYLLCILVLVPIFENHGLWLAFLIFLSFRGITLGVRYPRLERELT